MHLIVTEGGARAGVSRVAGTVLHFAKFDARKRLNNV